MNYEVACPHCHGRLELPAARLSTAVRCPNCSQHFVPVAGEGLAGMVGRPFSFSCSQCRSRLEAYVGMVGQRGLCPTCGVEFTIPAPHGQATRVAGTAPETEYTQPVHAYAAAGAEAPTIVRLASGERAIECPRCRAVNEVSRDNCRQCAMPFTLEGAQSAGDSGGAGNLAIASMVLGLVGLPMACVGLPSLLAVIFGALAMRSDAQGRRSAIAGLVMGIIGVLAFVAVVAYGLL